LVLVKKALDKNGFKDKGVKIIVENITVRPHIHSLNLCKY